MDSKHKAVSSNWMLLHRLRNEGLTLLRIVGNTFFAKKNRGAVFPHFTLLAWIEFSQFTRSQPYTDSNQERACPFFLPNLKEIQYIFVLSYFLYICFNDHIYYFLSTT